MNYSYDEMTSRNIGVFSTEEQDKLRKSCVAIAGVGGIGGLLAERLTRLGIGKLKLSDPGYFELSHFNRQFCANMETIGKNKVDVISKELLKINPELKIDYDFNGLSNQKDTYFFAQNANVIIDARDYFLLKEAILLQRAARTNEVYYMFALAIGFGSISVIFAPDKCSVEEYNGFPKDLNLEQIPDVNLSLEKLCPYIPDYIRNKLDIHNLKETIDNKQPGTVNGIGIGLGVIILSFEIINLLLGNIPVNIAPKYSFIDLYEKKFFCN